MFGGNYGYIPNNGWPVIGNCSATQSAWTWEEDKVFERAILDFGEERPDRWHRIADWIPRKSPEEVRAHYEALVHDVFAIDSGLVEPPSYSDDSSSESSEIPSWAASRSEKKKKGNSWTPEEHRLFVCGLETYGKSDWRSISRNMVKTKTSAQVASHAQKYFLRHKSLEKKRPSIHDITTTVNTCPIPSPAQFPNQGCSMGHQDFNHSM